MGTFSLNDKQREVAMNMSADQAGGEGREGLDGFQSLLCSIFGRETDSRDQQRARVSHLLGSHSQNNDKMAAEISLNSNSDTATFS